MNPVKKPLPANPSARVPPEPFALPHGLCSHVDHVRWINKDGQVGTTRPTLTHFVREVFGRANVMLDLIELHRRGLGHSLPDALQTTRRSITCCIAGTISPRISVTEAEPV